MVTLNSFSGNRVQGPHSLLVFRPEFAQRKAVPRMALLVLPAGSPCSLSFPDTGSLASGPSSPQVDFRSARAFLGPVPCCPGPVSPPLGGGGRVGSPPTRQKGAYQESPKSKSCCWTSRACSEPDAPSPDSACRYHVLSLLC